MLKKIVVKIKYIFRIILFKLIDFELFFYKAKKSGQKKLLIIRIDSIGDFVIFSPMLKYYKKLYFDYSITLLVNKVDKELAERFDDCEKIIYFDRKKFNDNIFYRRELLLAIKKQGWDIAIYPAYSREPMGDCLIKISGAKQRIGFDGDLSNISAGQKGKSEGHYTKLIKINSNIIPETEKNRKFTEALGVKVDNDIPLFIPSESDNREAERILLKNNIGDNVKFVVVHPGAGDVGRMWPLDKYCQLIEWLKGEKKLEIIICGSESERYLAERIRQKIDFPIVDIVGKTSLPVLASIFKKSYLFVGNDTGPTHLAVAVGASTVCLIGGGHPGRYFPLENSDRNKFVYHMMPCFGCKWFCKYDVAKCVQDITLLQVLEAVKQIIQ
jgi:ADP-heptose:LPS heptosyltransferase